MFTKVLIFAYYKQDIKTIVETDSSNYIGSGVFLQLSDDKLLYPIAFFFKNLNLIECNYEIYNKKLLAFIKYFE